MSHKIHLEASAYQLIRQDKAQVTLSLEVIQATRAQVQKSIQQTAQKTLTILQQFRDVQSSSLSQNITENFVRENTQEFKKEGFKGTYQISLVGYDFAQMNKAIEAVDAHAQVVGIVTSLSSKVKAQLEDTLTQTAIKNLQARALIVAQSLGHEKFSIKKLNVSNAQGDHMHALGMSNITTSAALLGNASDTSNLYVQPRDEKVSLSVKAVITLKQGK